MVKYIVIPLLLVSFVISGQNEFLRVDYIINYNTEVPNQKLGSLYYSQGHSDFIYGKKESNNNVEKGEDNKIKVQFKGTIRYTSIDANDDKIISKVSIRGRSYILREKSPFFNWDIVDDYKKIGSYLCQKALVTFRGREYTAWFAQELPVSSGPWKFSGLPGLILEISDNTGRYEWIAQNIITETNADYQLPTCDSCEEIDLREYEHLRYESNEQQSMMVRNLPRGTQTTYTPGPRNDIEIDFEH